jgi:hypothetical protein
VKPHWTDRGGGRVAPLGFGALRLHDGPGMAVLAGADAPWPARAERAEGIRFMGYSLDTKRFPTFRYRMGDVSVEEHYEIAGDYASEDERFTRVLKLKGNAPEGLSLRIATGGMSEENGGWRHHAGVHFTVTGGTARLRGGNELIVAPAFTGGAAGVRIGGRWIP